MNPKYKSILTYFALLIVIFLIVHVIGSVTLLRSNIVWLLWFSFVFYVARAISNQLWERVVRNSQLLPIEQVIPKGKAVLITGCDTGFGHQLVHQLLDYGFTVFAGCLRPDSAGARKLKSYGKSNKIFILDMDVTKEQSVQNSLNSFKHSLEANNLQLFALINNAGIMASTEIEFGSVKLFQSQMDVNCMGAIRVTKAFLPFLRQSSLLHQGVIRTGKPNMEVGPRVINVCSLAGRFAIPGINSYCVSKAALINFSDGLRREMIKWGIEVITIEPHLFKTNLVNSENQHRTLDDAWSESSKELQTAYGQSYLDGYKSFLDKMLGSARDGVSLVVNSMFVATTDAFPAQSYRVVQNDYERVRVCLYDFVPEPVLDLISHLVMSLQVGKPAAYSQGQKDD